MAETTDKRIPEIMERYKETVEGWNTIYNNATDDLKFVYDVDGGQWPDEVRNERKGRPIITVNKLQKFVRQLRGDQMMNRPRIKVIPVDDKADVQSAKLYNGLIRQIEYLSDAAIAYDTAYMHAVSSSIGYFRIITQYGNDKNFEQDIVIKRILNPTSIHYDPMAQEFELQDAKYCFVDELLKKEVYKKLYPKSEVIGLSQESGQKLFGEWITSENVKVAEYFYKEYEQKKIAQLNNGEIIDITGLSIKEAKSKASQVKATIVRDRFVDTHKVKWCKTNGYEILEESEWPGKDIPIIPVFGDEIVVSGKRYYLSLTRGAKGPQQMYNYWATAATENVALSPKAPYMVDHRQIKGFENEWNEANVKNRMYIRFNAVAGLAKPQREPQTQVPNAIMSMMQTTAYDIEDHLGRYESSKGEAGNERSGKAIIARVAQSDKGTFTFVDNLTRAIVYAGRQLIDLIPKIYDTQRAIRIMDETGEQQVVNVNSPVAIEEGGSVRRENDLTVGQYDLVATVGASYASKRQEMTQMLIESMQYAPSLAPVIAPLIFKYSDFPGAEEVSAAINQEVQKQQQMAMMQQQQAGTA